MDFSPLQKIDWQAISSFLTLVAVIIALCASRSVSRQIRAEATHMLGEIRLSLSLIIHELDEILEEHGEVQNVIIKFGDNSIVKRNVARIQQLISEKGHFTKNRWLRDALIDASIFAKIMNDYKGFDVGALKHARKDMILIENDLAWKYRFRWLKKHPSRFKLIERRVDKNAKEVIID